MRSSNHFVCFCTRVAYIFKPNVNVCSTDKNSLSKRATKYENCLVSMAETLREEKFCAIVSLPLTNKTPVQLTAIV